MTEIATLKENGFQWIDLENPDSAELMKLAEKCLQNSSICLKAN